MLLLPDLLMGIACPETSGEPPCFFISLLCAPVHGGFILLLNIFAVIGSTPPGAVSLVKIYLTTKGTAPPLSSLYLR